MAHAGLAFLIAVMAAAGVPAQETTTAPQDSERAVVKKVLDEQGAAPVIQWIQQRRYGKVTIEVGGRLKPAVGPPNAKFVTPASVLNDLRLLGVDVETFAAEIAAIGPVEKRQVVISQADVGPAGGGGATTTGAQSSGSARTCREMSEQAAIRIASNKGCRDGRVSSVDEEGEDIHVMFSVFQITGECRDASTEQVRGFTARIKCTSRATAQLTVEGPDGFVSASVHTSQLGFSFTN